MTESDRAYIGTKLGGDPSTLDELELWLRDEVNPQVESVAAGLAEIVEELFDVWHDHTAEAFQELLARGRNDTYQLADRVEAVGGLIGGSATAMRSSQARLDLVSNRARGEGLDVENGCIFTPLDDEYVDVHEMSAPGYEEQQEKVETFLQLREDADKALEPVAVQLEKYSTNGIWDRALFTSGALVVTGTRELVEKRKSEITSYLTPGQTLSENSTLKSMVNRVGLASRVLAGVGTLIGGLEVVYKIGSGHRPGTVIVEFGASTGFAAALTAGGFFVAGPAGAAVGALLAIVTSSDVGDYFGSRYDAAVPPTALERLYQYSGDSDYAQRGDANLHGRTQNADNW